MSPELADDEAVDVGQVEQLARHAAHRRGLQLRQAARADDDQVDLAAARETRHAGRRIAAADGGLDISRALLARLFFGTAEKTLMNTDAEQGLVIRAWEFPGH